MPQQIIAVLTTWLSCAAAVPPRNCAKDEQKPSTTLMLWNAWAYGCPVTDVHWYVP